MAESLVATDEDGRVTVPAAAQTPVDDGELASKLYVDKSVSTGGGQKLSLSGGTLTGFLNLHADPTAPSHAATKGYVDDVDAYIRDDFSAADAALQAAINARLPLAGGTLTGFLLLHAAPTALLHAATKGYVDSIDAAIRTAFAAADAALQTSINAKLPLAGGTLTGFLTLHAKPTAALHAASKGYVDDALAALPPGSGVIISAAAPANPVPGQLWYRTVAPVGLFVWFNDGDSSQWVQTAGGSVGLSGEQAVNTAGLTQAVFDQVPEEATSLTFSFSNVTFSGGNALFDFFGATGQAHGTVRQINAAAYGAPTALNAAEIELDNIGGTGGIMGTYFLERIQVSGNRVWSMTGSHRRGNSLITHAGRLILNQTGWAPPRFRVSAGTFASNPIVCRWRT
jgi:hypothetical protein